MQGRFSERVEALNLDADKFIVIGSGLLDQLGIRRAEDIDLVVSDGYYSQLALDAVNWREVGECDRKHLEHNDFKAEVWTELPLKGERLQFGDLLDNSSQEIDGIKFTNLDFVRRWKQWRNRQKDQEDLRLIDEYER